MIFSYFKVQIYYDYGTRDFKQKNNLTTQDAPSEVLTDKL